MKQDITQKGGEWFFGNKGDGGQYESTQMSCAKRLKIGRPGGNTNEGLAGKRYYDECLLAEAKEQEQERIRQQQAAQKKRDEQEAATQAAKEKKDKENEISYSTGMFSSSPIEYKTPNNNFKFYKNKNGNKFVGRILLSNGQENEQVKYLFDPKKLSLQDISKYGDISPSSLLSLNQLKELKQKLEPKRFSLFSSKKEEKEEKEEEEEEKERQIISVGGKRKTKKSKKSKKSTKKSKKSTKKTRKSRK